MNWIPYQKFTINTVLDPETLQKCLSSSIRTHHDLWSRIGCNWSNFPFNGKCHGNEFKINYAKDGFNRIVCCGRIANSTNATYIHLRIRYNYFGIIIMLLLVLVFIDSLISCYLKHQINWLCIIPLLLYCALMGFFNYFAFHMKKSIQTTLKLTSK